MPLGDELGVTSHPVLRGPCLEPLRARGFAHTTKRSRVEEVDFGVPRKDAVSAELTQQALGRDAQLFADSLERRLAARRAGHGFEIADHGRAVAPVDAAGQLVVSAVDERPKGSERPSSPPKWNAQCHVITLPLPWVGPQFYRFPSELMLLPTDILFQAQPSGLVPYCGHLKVAWGAGYLSEGAPHLTLVLLFAAARAQWMGLRPDAIDRLLASVPETSVRKKGASLELMVRIDGPIVPRQPGESLPSYLTVLKPIFIEVSQTVAPVLLQAAKKTREPFSAHWSELARAMAEFEKVATQHPDFGAWIADEYARAMAAFLPAARVPLAEMDEDRFWSIVGSFGGSSVAAARALRQLSDSDLAALVGRLHHVLWQLDTPEVARGVYGSPGVPSGDDFVDARCAIVLGGPESVAAALGGRALMPDQRAEWLLVAGDREYERRNGREPTWEPRWSVESGSNPAWAKSP